MYFAADYSSKCYYCSKEDSKGKGDLKTMKNHELEDLNVTLWRVVYQTYTRFKNGMDKILSEQGLTME